MNRTKNATRNVFFGMMLKVYQIIVPFLMRTAMIYIMGVEYLGLNSLFTSVLQVLNMAELGVGSAMIYSIYKPIADNNEQEICALLRLYRRYYRIIGLVIGAIGLCLTPIIPRLINGTVPDNLNVYILYLLNLSATVITYWLFAYKASLLQAHQRNDIASKVMIITNTIQYSVQFLVLWLTKNYYLYVLVMLGSQALANIITAVLATRMYPNYKPMGELDEKKRKSINQRIKDLFTAKLGSTVVTSADTIVISSFLGLTILAMYQNYYFIMSSVMGIITIIFGSCLAGVGNSMITESIDKNYNDFCVITFFINWIATVCICCFATLYHPFISLWVGAEYTFDGLFVLLMCVYFYLVVMQQMNGMYKDAAGIWHQDRYRPLISAILNLALNITFVKIWGIYAIVASTVLSYLFLAMPWMIQNIFKYIFKRSCMHYVVSVLKYFATACIIMGICAVLSRLTTDLNLYMQIVINGIVSVLLSNVLLIIIYRKSDLFCQMLQLINRVTGDKFDRF